MKAREFGALTECPRCGEIAYHWMTEPKWPPIPEDVEQEVVRDFTGAIVRHHVSETYPVGTKQVDIDWNTSNCKVVRTCKNCSHDWGEE